MDLLTVAEVVVATDRSALLDWRDGDAYLAGGTALYSEPNPQLRRLIDLSGFDWPALHSVGDGDLEIAATCTLAELDRYGVPLFSSCCHALLGSFKVHHMATVGGNLCAALPAGPLIALSAALDGQCLVWAPDGSDRVVPAAAFVLGPAQNCLRPGELLRSVTLPAAALAARTAFRQASLSNLGRSAVLLIGRQDRDGSTTFTATASTPRPVQLKFAGLPGAPDLLAALDAEVTGYYDDVHGSPAWRRHLTRHLLAEIRDELS